MDLTWKISTVEPHLSSTEGSLITVTVDVFDGDALIYKVGLQLPATATENEVLDAVGERVVQFKTYELPRMALAHKMIGASGKA